MTREVSKKLEEAGFDVLPLEMEDVDACVLIEQQAFNRLREAWHQPEQQPRRIEWLKYQARFLPENVLVLKKEKKVAGWIMVHQLGTLGWMGPVVIDPAQQGHGLGRILTEWSLRRLKSLSCTTIGLETWAFNYTNLGLYTKCGFDIGPVIGVLEKPVSSGKAGQKFLRLASTAELSENEHGMAKLCNAVSPGLDYAFLAKTLVSCNLGEVLLWGDPQDPQALAVMRYLPYTITPAQDFANVEVLAVRPDFRKRMGQYLEDLQAIAIDAGKKSLRVSVPSDDTEGFREMLTDHGFRLLKTRLRMLAEEQPVEPGAVNYLSFSV